MHGKFAPLVGVYTRMAAFQWIETESQNELRLSFDEFWTIIPKDGQQSLWRKRAESVPVSFLFFFADFVT